MSCHVIRRTSNSFPQPSWYHHGQRQCHCLIVKPPIWLHLRIQLISYMAKNYRVFIPPLEGVDKGIKNQPSRIHYPTA